jgi:hypothetical protein
MPMKMSLALQPRRRLNRSEAWGCLTANLALPGSGSLVAGRRSGYLQMILAVAGLLITLLAGVRFIVWYAANRALLSAEPPPEDPFGSFVILWTAVRWPLAGVAIFTIAMVWALGTSVQILNGATEASVPPRIP